MILMSKKQVESILEELRPAIQADGGDVHLVDITTEGVVQVRFEGECLRCPSRDMTLRSGIETTLRNRLHNITGVEEVQETIESWSGLKFESRPSAPHRLPFIPAPRIGADPQEAIHHACHHTTRSRRNCDW